MVITLCILATHTLQFILTLHPHTDLINLTNDPHCSMATLSDLIFERLKNTSWVVVFKNLITAHNLMTLGNEVCTYICLCRGPPSEGPLKNGTQGANTQI